MRHGLDFVDLENPEVCFPTVHLEQQIMIGTEMPRCVLTMDGCVEYAAEVGAIDGITVHADSDEATGELVHDHEHPVLRSTMDSHRKRLTRQRLSLVCPMNESHEGPVPSGARR